MDTNFGRVAFTFIKNARPRRAFTLLELIAVLAVFGLLAAIGFPSLTRILQRERIEGFLRTATLTVEKAKSEAAKRNAPVVVRADYAQNALTGFADLNRDSLKDGAEPELFFLVLPSIGSGRERSLRFWSAEDESPEGDGAVEGFSDDPSPGELPNLAVLEPDGSARAAGAFRFGLPGNPGNFYELRVDPAATARVKLRKYLWASPPAFHTRNTDAAATWPWY